MNKGIRDTVAKLAALGPLPDSGSASEEQILRLTDALMKITPPLSEEEAILLASVFGNDECFGLAWTLVHLIESVEGGAPIRCFPDQILHNEWVRLLIERSMRT